MSLSSRRFRPLQVLAAAVAGMAVALTTVGGGVGVQIVSKAAGIPSNASGIGGFVNGANALITPVLVMMAAVAPLGLLAGGIATMFGSRRGIPMMATCAGVLLLLGSAKGLIA